MLADTAMAYCKNRNKRSGLITIPRGLFVAIFVYAHIYIYIYVYIYIYIYLFIYFIYIYIIYIYIYRGPYGAGLCSGTLVEALTSALLRRWPSAASLPARARR